MSDQSPEQEQDRLYRERELRAGTDPGCEADIVLRADVDPVPTAADCDVVETPTPATFLRPNPTPPADIPDRLLPGALVVLSRPVTAECTGGSEGLGGTVSPVILPTGTDAQSVFIDDITEIAQNELFRLTAYIDELQIHVDADLVAAIDGNDFATFDAGIVTITGTSAAVATLIRELLVSAQSLADAIAQTSADAQLICGWLNEELWVICQEADPGYSVVYVDPGVEVESYHMAAGQFESEISQADANAQAAQMAALRLNCLVPNEEVIATCSNQAILDETMLVTWPTTWTFPALDSDGNPIPLTLADQGADTWGTSHWDDFTNSTATIPLNNLNGQEFVDVGGDRRTLRTTVVIPAGDPRASARTVEEANARALSLALETLDCFVPNRPRVVSCMTADLGNPAVISRATALTVGPTYTDRTALFTEMEGGDPVEFGGDVYNRRNVGILNFDAVNEQLDDLVSFEVDLWPGMYTGSSTVEAEDLADGHASRYLLCLWYSPEHTCYCQLTDGEEADGGLIAEEGEVTEQPPGDSPYAVVPHSRSKIFDYEDDVEPNKATLDLSKSLDRHVMLRGEYQSDTYPGENIAEAELRWTNIPVDCQAFLRCVYAACQTVCCTPKPDIRPYGVNGVNNWIPSGGVRPSLYSQDSVMQEWYTMLNTVALPDFIPCGSVSFYDPEAPQDTYDACMPPYVPPGPQQPKPTGSLQYSAGFARVRDDSSQIIPGEGYGAPARFLLGGLLPWGMGWGKPLPTGPGDPEILPLTPSIPDCYTDGGYTPNPWGMYTIGADSYVPFPWGFWHCAEGVAESSTPIDLSRQARALAQSRLDCTHIAWPRVINDCSNPREVPMASITSLIVHEGPSTLVANASSEAELISAIECRDIGQSGTVMFAGGRRGAASMSSKAAIQNVGNCDGSGLNIRDLYLGFCSGDPLGSGGPPVPFDGNLADALQTLMSMGDTNASAGGPSGPGEDPKEIKRNVFIEFRPTCSTFFVVFGPTETTEEEMRDAQARNTGIGVPSGIADLATLQTARPSSKIWYMASIFVELDYNQAEGRFYEDKHILVQVQQGPLVADLCAAEAPCEFGGVTLVPSEANPEEMAYAIRGGTVAAGYDSWAVSDYEVNVGTPGQWLVYMTVDVTVSTDDDGMFFLQGITDSSAPVISKTLYSGTENYPTGTPPTLPVGSGSVILPIGLLTVRTGGTAVLQPTGCGAFMLSHCNGFISYERMGGTGVGELSGLYSWLDYHEFRISNLENP